MKQKLEKLIFFEGEKLKAEKEQISEILLAVCFGDVIEMWSKGAVVNYINPQISHASKDQVALLDSSWVGWTLYLINIACTGVLEEQIFSTPVKN